MREATVNSRLLSAANYVRAGAVFADIGTDHGHLPIFLLENGIISRAVLSDINEGPLAKAKSNVKLHGLLDKTEFCLTDGAGELKDKGITDYAICGMGGELIRRIIESATQMHREGIRLILQPMSKPEEVREALANLGFKTIDESYSEDRNKFYLCICADFTGEKQKLSDIELELGNSNLREDTKQAEIGYLKVKRQSLMKKRNGKKHDHIDTSYYDKIIESLDKRLSELEK